LNAWIRNRERYFIARPTIAVFTAGLEVARRDQAKVVAIRVIHYELRTAERGPAQLLLRRDEPGGA